MHGSMNYDNATDTNFSQMRFIIYGCSNNSTHAQEDEYIKIRSYHYIDGYVDRTDWINVRHATDGTRGYRMVYSPWFDGPHTSDVPHFAIQADPVNAFAFRISRIYVQFR